MIVLVRHALALPRRDWQADDQDRPLTARGVRQSTALAEALSDWPVEQILSSPATRCQQTVAPLAASRSMPVEHAGSLREGRADRALDLVLDLVGDALLCTHGDVVHEVLAGLRALGWPIPEATRCPKASTWVLSPRDAARYVAPPA